MTYYTLGDIEKLLGVKAHIIRYWEKEIPLLKPKRDGQGKRMYSGRDIQLFLRVKYLLYERRFTVEGARDQLFRELAGSNQDLHSLIAALRGELAELYFILHKEE